jgi:hypothetical protein
MVNRGQDARAGFGDDPNPSGVQGMGPLTFGLEPEDDLVRGEVKIVGPDPNRDRISLIGCYHLIGEAGEDGQPRPEQSPLLEWLDARAVSTPESALASGSRGIPAVIASRGSHGSVPGGMWVNRRLLALFLGRPDRGAPRSLEEP